MEQSCPWAPLFFFFFTYMCNYLRIVQVMHKSRTIKYSWFFYSHSFIPLFLSSSSFPSSMVLRFLPPTHSKPLCFPIFPISPIFFIFLPQFFHFPMLRSLLIWLIGYLLPPLTMTHHIFGCITKLHPMIIFTHLATLALYLFPPLSEQH